MDEPVAVLVVAVEVCLLRGARPGRRRAHLDIDLEAVAEGVEDEEQEKLLRLLRCDEIQGYLMGKPFAGV